MLEIEDQVRRYAEHLLDQVAPVEADEILRDPHRVLEVRSRARRRWTLPVAGLAAGLLVVLAVSVFNDESDRSVVRAGLPDSSRSQWGPAASPNTGRFQVPVLPPGFSRIVADEFGGTPSEPLRGYTETFSPWDGDPRTRDTAPSITVTTWRGDTSHYIEKLEATNLPVAAPATEREDLTVRDKPALTATVHRDARDLVVIVWVDQPGLAIDLSGSGVNRDDLVRVAESLQSE
jgi:hypothetical protein